MAKILGQYEWNKHFYAMAELDNGSRIELKSDTPTDFATLLVRYNDLAKQPVVDEQKKQLDAYAIAQWPVLAKQAEKVLPMTTEKTISEWVNKAALVSVSPPAAVLVVDEVK